MQKLRNLGMFTGIIETMGKINEVNSKGTNKSFWIETSITHELKIDQSLAHNGVCLIVEDIQKGVYKITAIKETLEKTNLNQWAIGTHINLERSLQLSGRLDGHFVQAHVDTVGTLLKKKDLNGSWELIIDFPKKFAPLIIEKGSICLEGISLTIFAVKKSTFRVAIIPYTWEHTNLQFLKEEDVINLEFDLLGKYINRKLSLKR